jgi:hypothetical protein
MGASLPTNTLAGLAVGAAAVKVMHDKFEKKKEKALDRQKLALDEQYAQESATANAGLKASNEAYARKLAAAQKAQVLSGASTIDTTTI